MKLKELLPINNRVKIIAKKESKSFYFGRFIPQTKFMFVGEMPTCPRNLKDWDPYDNFNLSHTDRKFFEILNKHGFGGCYITDIVKKTEMARRPTESELLTWRPLLLLELGYIKPDVVIAVGENAHDILRKLNIKNLELIWHPARLRFPSNISKFSDQINK